MTDFQRVRLVRCRDCGLVFCPGIPSVDELVRHYEGYSRQTEFVSPISIQRRVEWLRGFEAYRVTTNFLDVGCGTGELLNQAKQHGWTTYGTEFTDKAVNICRRNGHLITQGPLAAASFQEGSFDVAIYCEVIEHINNQPEEFRRVWSLLRPGGLLFITTPNFDSLSRRLMGDRWNVIQYPEHLAYFTAATVERLMLQCGFEPKWIRTTGVSLTKFVDGVRPGKKAPSVQTRSVPGKTLDEKARRVLELPGIKILKAGVNKLLNLARLGDSLDAGFVKKAKPATSPEREGH
jgi:2-polyprenyl-3-methyl-5-hydroxy-6-metoxy-1,4-benzoquinol methylase